MQIMLFSIVHYKIVWLPFKKLPQTCKALVMPTWNKCCLLDIDYLIAYKMEQTSGYLLVLVIFINSDSSLNMVAL